MSSVRLRGVCLYRRHPDDVGLSAGLDRSNERTGLAAGRGARLGDPQGPCQLVALAVTLTGVDMAARS